MRYPASKLIRNAQNPYPAWKLIRNARFHYPSQKLITKLQMRYPAKKLINIAPLRVRARMYAHVRACTRTHERADERTDVLLAGRWPEHTVAGKNFTEGNPPFRLRACALYKWIFEWVFMIVKSERDFKRCGCGYVLVCCPWFYWVLAGYVWPLSACLRASYIVVVSLGWHQGAENG